jgi:hypothetical protein
MGQGREKMMAVCLAAGLALAAGAGVACAAGNSAEADEADVRVGEDVIRLRTGDVTGSRDLSAVVRGKGGKRAGWHLIQLDGPMTPERREALRGAGVRVSDYMTGDGFLADLSGAAEGSVEKLGFVKRAGAYRQSWKIDPDIGRPAWGSAERRAIAARGEVAVLVYLFPGADLAAATNRMRTIPGLALRGRGTLVGAEVLGMTVPRAAVNALARLDEVRFIEEAPELSSRTNTNTRWIVQSNVQNFTPFYDAGINGTGQIVGMLDEKLNAAHCAFADTVPFGPLHRKILAYNTTTGSDPHGTQVAGVLAGFDPANPLNNNTGVAYGAKIVYNEYPVPLDGPIIASRMLLHMQQGAFVHNNSYGQDSLTAYNGLCVSIDDFTWNYDDQLLVWAVSNQPVINNPENAKNPLAVTGTSNFPQQNDHRIGGAGPTTDGRRKPDVMAPGRTQTSSGNTCGVSGVLQGTSFASPAVAGAAVLAREYFVRGFYPSGTARAWDAFAPSGPLLKAVLVNGAQDSSDPGYPSNREGWGRIELDQNMNLGSAAGRMIVREARNQTGTALSTGQRTDVLFRVRTSSRLRVTLTWYDAPASLNAALAPVNNLDLIALSPSGATFRGNVFQGGVSVSGGSPDVLNNLEQVHLLGAQAGLWSVSIEAPAVQVGRQGYGLVISGDIEPCAAELTGDGVVDFEDFEAFMSAFDAGVMDINDDGQTDFDDFLGFFNAFDAGC